MEMKVLMKMRLKLSYKIFLLKLLRDMESLFLQMQVDIQMVIACWDLNLSQGKSMMQNKSKVSSKLFTKIMFHKFSLKNFNSLQKRLLQNYSFLYLIVFTNAVLLWKIILFWEPIIIEFFNKSNNNWE